MTLFPKKLSDKNIFDYLEEVFELIFSKNGQYNLRSSYIIGIFTFLISIIFLISILFGVVQLLSEPPLGIKYLLIILLSLLGIFIVSFFESSFYAIIVPMKLSNLNNDIPEKGGEIIIKDMDLLNDIILWKKYIGSYLYYLTIHSIIFLVVLLLGFLVCIFTEFLVSGILLLAIGYVYILYRLSIAWYITLFEGHSGFLESWKYIGGMVWSTICKFFVFNGIVWIGSGIPFYIATLFPSITLSSFTNILEIITRNISIMSIDFSTGITIQNLNQIFNGVDIGNIDIYSCVMAIILYAFIIKIGTVLGCAMNHMFGVKYFLDIKQFFIERNQK